MRDTLLARDEERPYEEYIANKCLGITVLLLWSYNIFNEVKQARGTINTSSKNCCDYFKSIWNWLDIAGLSLTLLITLHTMTEMTWLTDSKLRSLAACTCLFIFVKMFDWLRLFKQTSFYV